MATPGPYAPQYPYPAPRPGNGLAVAAMVLGIIALVMFWAWFLGGILGILAIIFGILGRSKARQVGVGGGAAMAGLICGIIAVVLAVVFVVFIFAAVSAFDDYTTKARRSEADLQLNRIERQIKVYQIEKGELPASTKRTPDQPACTQGGSKQRVTAAEWRAGGWSAIDVAIDDRLSCQYEWTKDSATKGHITAYCDLDCDLQESVTKTDLEVIDGNVTATHHPATPD